MNRLVIKSTLAAAALAVSLGTVMTAKAGQLDETLVSTHGVASKTLTFSRAELATEQGRQSLERRIRRAAEAVCGPVRYREAGSLSRSSKAKECYNQAVAQAMSQVEADQVASITR